MRKSVWTVLREYLPLILFCLGLVVCIFSGLPIICALVFGYLVFFTYGLARKQSPKSLLEVSWKGMKKVLMIAVVMLLIGMLTAAWRGSGTIALLVSAAAEFITPEFGLLGAFLLNGLISVLTGTSFGTAATMGVITMSMLKGMGIPMEISAGAILAGVYVGDRCSPVSTSALLVCTVTDTNIYKNLRLMVKTGMVPLIAASLLFLALGFFLAGNEAVENASKIFEKGFDLGLVALVPALVIVVCMCFKFDIRNTLALSLFSALPICYFTQKMTPAEIGTMLISGYESHIPEIAVYLNGGGLLSMASVCAIILVASTFIGLFEKTGLLESVRNIIVVISRRLSVFGTVVLTSVLTVCIACNQALPIMLTRELCRDVEPDGQKMAIDLENSVVVIAPLIPWCIAGMIPLTTIGAGPAAIPWALYLWFLPLWQLIVQSSKWQKIRNLSNAQ